MNTKYLENLIKTLSPDERIEINNLGNIKVVDKFGKKKNAGTLFQTVNEIVPLNTPPWVNVPEKAIKSFSDFGVKPKRIVKNYKSDVIIGAFQMLLDLEIPILGIFNESTGVKYNTKTVGEYRGFYNKDGKLRFVENENKRYYNTESPQQLNTVKYKEIIP